MSDRTGASVCAKHFHLLHSGPPRWYTLRSATRLPVSCHPPTLRCTSPHFAQWINQAEWWGTRHRVCICVYIPIPDEARRNSVASIYYNKRDIKRGRPNAMAGDTNISRITRIAHANYEWCINRWKPNDSHRDSTSAIRKKKNLLFNAKNDKNCAKVELVN